MKIPTLKLLAPTGLILSTALFSVGCGGSNSATTPIGTYDSSLQFDVSAYTTITVTVDGTAMKVHKYGPIKYVANPIKAASTQTYRGNGTQTLSDPYCMQEMYVYVPEASASDQKTGIFVVFDNSGWAFSIVKDWLKDGTSLVSNYYGFDDVSDDQCAIANALKAGYVVVSPGNRSRNAVAADGTYMGKSPAALVDAKAVIRYLKLNDAVMPGSAERIIINGKSGGGAQVTAVAASGNSADYYPYLAEAGAAGISGSGSSATSTLKDDVFAVTGYCPITDLPHADQAYEWQFNLARVADTTASASTVAASTEIANSFNDYLKSLNLKLEDGKTSFNTSELPSILTAQMAAEINRQLANGVSVPNYGGSFPFTDWNNNTTYVTNKWLTITGSGTSATVASIDYNEFVKFIYQGCGVKGVPAFDGCGLTTSMFGLSESNLFGPSTVSYRNITEYSWNHNLTVGDGSGIYDTGLTFAQYMATTDGATLALQGKMTSPIPYLTASTGCTPCPNWYVRYGMADTNTSFAVETVLLYALRNNANIKDINFKFPYMTPHAGNYDTKESFAWIKAKLAANPL